MYDEIIDRSELLFRMKLLKDKIDAFENGSKYLRMKEEHRQAREADFRRMKRLEKEAEQAHAEAHRVRDLWYQTCQDILRECERRIKEQEQAYEKQLRQKDEEIDRLRNALDKALEKSRQDHEKLIGRTGELYEAKGLLEEEQEKNRALTARINKDYRTSSKPSSMSPNHKVIQNSREKTGRSPGGQPGHIHHGRKRQEVTETVVIPAPEKYMEDDNYAPTGRMVRKQLIMARIVTHVVEYVTPEFRDQTTGQRVHADFPPGIADDVNYDGSVKALAYIINNELYTSIDKTREFLKSISHGKIDISNGFICSLGKKFSERTEPEREEAFLGLMSSPVLHADFTFGRMNGKQAAVIITTDGTRVLYQAREKKGDEGVKDSPLEYYEGTLVSDHEAALIRHGSRHQECLAHIERYARGSDQNELGKTWGGLLVNWIKESVAWWNGVADGSYGYSKKDAEAHIKKLREILEKAKEEYEYEPPSEYYPDGYNTYKRMEEDFEDYVLFLRDPSVPPTNNAAERLARKFKRKAHQVMSFRSKDGVKWFCDGLSMIESIKEEGGNLFDEVAERFNQGIEIWHY